MRDLSSVVEGLRLVQRARKRFLELWTLEKDVIIPGVDDDDDPGSQPPEAGRD